MKLSTTTKSQSQIFLGTFLPRLSCILFLVSHGTFDIAADLCSVFSLKTDKRRHTLNLLVITKIHYITKTPSFCKSLAIFGNLQWRVWCRFFSSSWWSASFIISVALQQFHSPMIVITTITTLHSYLLLMKTSHCKPKAIITFCTLWLALVNSLTTNQLAFSVWVAQLASMFDGHFKPP